MPTSQQQLKDEIRRHIGEIADELCRDVIKNFDHRVEVCRRSLGRHWAILYFIHNCQESDDIIQKRINKFSLITLFYLLLISIRLNGTPLYTDTALILSLSANSIIELSTAKSTDYVYRYIYVPYTCFYVPNHI